MRRDTDSESEVYRDSDGPSPTVAASPTRHHHWHDLESSGCPSLLVVPGTGSILVYRHMTVYAAVIL